MDCSNGCAPAHRRRDACGFLPPPTARAGPRGGLPCRAAGCCGECHPEPSTSAVGIIDRRAGPRPNQKYVRADRPNCKQARAAPRRSSGRIRIAPRERLSRRRSEPCGIRIEARAGPIRPDRSRDGGSAAHPTTLYFVGPNMVENERRFGFIPREFALWVAVHEITHRFQFAGVPWLRPRFLSLIERYFETVISKRGGRPRAWPQAAARLARRKCRRRSGTRSIAGDNRAEIGYRRLQALMAVVEGHGTLRYGSRRRRVIPSWRE